MKKVFKIILLVWPIVLLLGMCCLSYYQRQQIDRKLLKADGVIWKTGEKQFVVRVHQRKDGEKLYILIKVVGPENKEIYKTNETIDRDMFGGGFVRAVQADKDPEKEIAVWQPRNSYYLDFSDGSVEKLPFDRVPQQVKDLAENWHRYNVMAGITTVILFLFVLCYYILYIIVKGILRLFKRKKLLLPN